MRTYARSARWSRMMKLPRNWIHCGLGPLDGFCHSVNLPPPHGSESRKLRVEHAALEDFRSLANPRAPLPPRCRVGAGWATAHTFDSARLPSPVIPVISVISVISVRKRLERDVARVHELAHHLFFFAPSREFLLTVCHERVRESVDVRSGACVEFLLRRCGAMLREPSVRSWCSALPGAAFFHRFGSPRPSNTARTSSDE